MKIFSAKQIKKWDEFTIKNTPITSAELMEKAATECEEQLLALIKERDINQIRIFCGSGDNGGDGYVIARKLAMQGLGVSVYTIETSHKTSNDNERNFFRLVHEVAIHPQLIANKAALPRIYKHDLVIDAILGIGLNKPTDGLLAELIEHINQSQAYVVAIDVPTGLPVDIDVTVDLTQQSIIKANQTLTFQTPKPFFLIADSYPYTGEFKVLDIGLLPEFTAEEDCFTNIITSEMVQIHRKPRPKFSHKGTFGHALIIAGSYGKMGAAVLATKAALRTGCGLATAFVPKCGIDILQTSVPEAMVLTDVNEKYITEIPKVDDAFKAVAIGPGITTHTLTVQALLAWLPSVNIPIVLDADALNCIGEAIQKGATVTFPEHCVLTPHPKEFDRIVGDCASSIERLHKQRDFALKNNVTVVVKGAHTSIATPSGELYFNSTGNPMLATAGSGDVLTGIIVSLLAQGYTTTEAAIGGVYVHGKCADFWAENGNNTMLATDIIGMLSHI